MADSDSDIKISDICARELSRALPKITDTDLEDGYFLVLNKIKACNASEVVSFSRASCTYVQQEGTAEQPFLVSALGEIYLTGCDMLFQFLEHGKEPTQEPHRHALKALIDFVQGPEFEMLGNRLQKNDWTAAQVSAILLHHILSKLMPIDSGKPAFFLDKECEKELNYRCPCCLESLNGQYDDTSIGNTKVWHGRIDAIIGRDVGVACMDSSDTLDNVSNSSSERESDQSSRSSASDIVEVKNHSALRKKDVREVIAQTITFSFLEHSKQPEMVPLYGTISIGRKYVKFQFYDSVNDILLESNPKDLFKSDGNLLSSTVVIALWLTVNHSLFCSGVTQLMKDQSFHADFMKGQDEVKEIYKTELNYRCGQPKDCDTEKNFSEKVRIKSRNCYTIFGPKRFRLGQGKGVFS